MNLRAILMGLAFVVMWSSAFTSARIIVAQAPPMGTLAVRFIISGLIGMGLAYLLGERLRFTPAQWRAIVIFGLCQNALYLGLNFIAMQSVEASLASIIASSMPLWVGLAGWILFRERLTPMAIAGLVAGMIGVALIMGARLSSGVDLFGLGLCVAGVLALTVATLSVTGASSGGNVLMVVGAQMLVGAAALALASLVLERPYVVAVTPSLIAAFVYTTLVPGLLATFVWFKLVGMIGAIRAATFHFLNPFLGVAIAALVLGEAIGPLDFLGVAIIMGGILAVQLSKAQR
ncbi:DMT family transporter [Primorskyibacter sp. S187A]|uniref:DMT family transporter n=1 Tax=Primorskyibacter sp. S187A TaxID=3415130 RepID=UPI003C7BC487